MFDHFRTVFAFAFFFAMIGSVVGPYFGYQQLLSQKQECYIRSEYDNRFEYASAGIGILVGLAIVYREIRRKKETTDEPEGN